MHAECHPHPHSFYQVTSNKLSDTLPQKEVSEGIPEAEDGDQSTGKPRWFGFQGFKRGAVDKSVAKGSTKLGAEKAGASTKSLEPVAKSPKVQPALFLIALAHNVTMFTVPVNWYLPLSNLSPSARVPRGRWLPR